MSPMALTDSMLLEIGVPAGVTSSGSGSAQDSLARLVNAAVAAGVAASQRFVIPGIRDGVLTLTGVFAAGVLSCKVDLERSLDSGVSWKVVQAAMDVFANGEVRLAIAPGGLYRLNITTYTGAGAVTIYGMYVPIG